MRTRLTLEQFTAQMKARRTARAGDPASKGAAAVNGLRKYAARFEAAGDGDTGRRLNAYADKAERLLAIEAESRAAAQAERPDFLGDAVRAGAAELCRKLPATFPTEEDGVAFCRGLPFVEAKARAREAADAGFRAGKRAATARRDFTEVLESACSLATGDADTSKAIQTVIISGM
jgi:hypothetical protein